MRFNCSVLLVSFFLYLGFHLSGCKKDPENTSVIQVNQDSVHLDSLARLAEDSANPPIEIRLYSCIPNKSLNLCASRPCLSGFSYPVNPPDARRYYKARGLIPGEHMGEDWNGQNGGNSDFGDLIFSVADGVVIFAEEIGGGWGMVVRILHNYGTKEKPLYIESLYGHLASIWVKEGVFMKKGDPIGTIGNASGKYHAHLHLEMRTLPCMPVSWKETEGTDLSQFVDPTEFIKTHPIMVEGKWSLSDTAGR